MPVKRALLTKQIIIRFVLELLMAVWRLGCTETLLLY